MRDKIPGLLVLAAAFVLAACVGLALSMSFDDGSAPVADALKPAEIAAALPPEPEPTLPVAGMSALRSRPPVKPAPKVRHRARRHHAERVHRVVAVRHPVAVVAAAAPKVVVAPAPKPKPAPAAVVVAPKPVAAPAAPKPKPAPARAPVVFDDSA
jgi:translation initiation factor IF-3